MRRTPYVENNERLALKYATQLRSHHEKKANQMKTNRPELDVMGKVTRPSNVAINLSSSKNHRASPMLRRPSTGKNQPGEQNFSDTDTKKDPKHRLERRSSDAQYKLLNGTPSNTRYHLPIKARQSGRHDPHLSFVRDSSDQHGFFPKSFRTKSFRDGDTHLSGIYQRKEMTPGPGLRYDRDHAKTPRGYSNPRTSRERMPENRPIDTPFGKTMQLLDKKTKKTRNNQQNFFQYVLRFSYRTKKGFMPNNPGKINQDSFIISPNINKKSWQHYFGVCDGHGVYGHLVSSFTKNHLPAAISRARNLQKEPKQALTKSFQSTMEKLILDSKIDLSFSGSTVVGCYLFQQKLYCCNVGDSRAIIGSYDQKAKTWSAKSLSTDHKPTLKSEADRVLKCGGRVQSFKDPQGNPIGPLRVWLKEQNVPGLAMTRSFGDLVAASVGVSAEPQIFQYTMSQQDRIILIATDGVWQFLSNQDIIGMLSPYYETNKIQQACDMLLDKAVASWTRECSVIDDITFILLFMSYNDVN